MSRTRYIAAECAISMGINAALSVTFALLVFGGTSTVDLGGHEVMLDMVPQSFMVALMAALVPSLIARRRALAGRLRLRKAQFRLVLAAPLAGVAAAAAGTALYALLIPAAVVALPTFVAAKAAYGAALGGIVTAVALHRAIGREREA